MANKNFEVKHGLSVGGTERITSAGVGTFTDLNVTGTTTTIDTATLQVQDKNIVINYGSGDTSSTASGAGITIQDAVDASNDATLLWDASADEFDFSHTITAPSLTIAGNATFDTSTLFVDSSNNRVKMGDTATASATNAPLHVAKASTDVQAIFGDNNSSIDDPSIRIIGRNSANSAIRYMFAGLDADANHGFIGYNHGSGSFVSALNFDTSGNVGIGNANTTPVTTLDVKNAGDSAYTGGLLIRTGTSTSEASSLYHDNNSATTTVLANRYDNAGAAIKLILRASSGSPVTALTALGSGNVGIGTANPQKPLHISSSDNQPLRVESTDAYSGIELKDNGSSTYPPLISALSDDFIFYAGDSSSRGEVLRITSSGNLAIGGVTSPQSKIHTHIASSGGAYHQFTNSSTGSADGDGWKIGIHDDENLIIWGQESAESFRVYNNGAYRLTVDHNGAVDIPSANLYLTGSNDRRIKLSDSGIAGISDSNNTVNIRGDNDSLKLNAAGNGLHIFETNGTEKMRITATASYSNLCIGRTGTIGDTSVNLHLTTGGWAIGSGTAGNTTAGTYRRAYYSGNNGLYYWNGSNQAYLTSAGVWTDASDERLKKDIVDIPYGLEAVKSLKPRKYKMKDDDLEQVGFIAQEVKDIIPEVAELTTVEHADEDNGEQYGLSYGHLTAVLTKAIQEQQIIIEDLKSRIETLEG